MAESKLRRSFVLIATASVLLGLTVSGVSLAAPAKPAPTPRSISFDLATLTLSSTTHKQLHVSFSASESSTGGQHAESAGIAVTRKGLAEFHDWDFALKKGSLKFNPASGKGSLKVGAALRPYAAMTLTFTATGKKHTTVCHSSRTVMQPVTVHGSFSFNTRSTGAGRWGKVSKHAAHSFGGKSEVSEQFGDLQFCGLTREPCMSDISWSGEKTAGANFTSIEGSRQKVNGKTHTEISAFRNVSLNKPKGAERFDSLTVPDKHMTFTFAAGLPTVQVGAGGAVTGSASLVSTTPSSPFSISCGKSGTEVTNQWAAPYKNGKSPLTVHEQIEGPFKLPNLPADIDQDTVS
jgi:hypothetical protein